MILYKPMSQEPPVKPVLPTWAKVMIVLLVLASLCGTSIVALGVYALRKRLAMSKRAEGLNSIGQLSRGIIQCAESENPESPTFGPRGLPPSAGPVPLSLLDVKGTKYMSKPSDWAHPTFKCAKFEMIYPQYYQIEWHKKSETQGLIRATADFSSKGVADSILELPIECSGTGTSFHCQQGLLHEPTP